MQKKDDDIVVVGLNGALQKRLVLNSELIPGQVHRAQSMELGIGGKGQDVALALHSCLNTHCQLLQFVGSGPEGDQLLNLMQQQFLENNKSSLSTTTTTVRTQSPMRTCTTIITNDLATELVEPSGQVLPHESDALLQQIEEEIIKKQSSDNNKDDSTTTFALCIMGSMPPGVSKSMYATIYKNFLHAYKERQFVCVIDTVVGLDHLLSTTITLSQQQQQQHVMLKINLTELSKLTQTTTTTNENDDTSLLVVKCIQNFLSIFGSKEDPLLFSSPIQYMAITDGKDPAYFVSFHERKFQLYKIPIPNLQTTTKEDNEPLYPIGAGDAVAAGTLLAWTRQLQQQDDTVMNNNEKMVQVWNQWRQKYFSKDKDEEIDEALTAFCFGLACGSASCLKSQNSMFEVDVALDLFRSLPRPVEIN